MPSENFSYLNQKKKKKKKKKEEEEEDSSLSLSLCDAVQCRVAMSSDRKGLLKTIFTPNVGCGCGKTKPSDAIEPTPIQPRRDSSSFSLHDQLELVKIKSCPCPSSSSASHTTAAATATFSLPDTDASPTRRPYPAARRSGIGNSIAVAKDSDDPYRDFRDSMLQMVLEQGIYSRDGLQELLHCFLKLNSPRYHAVIIRAFTVIWNGVAPGGSSGGGGGGDLDVSPSPSPSSLSSSGCHLSEQ
ncbi:transcription repressor OFP6 [Syzygium oleosum]|uniref:transcription repressor OFP6 n=1 Tax=Syzygium oleosum TaxID=219896 RepID=UPI0024BB8786|nr:transcription repressor OFP6 [Syzygium oleosum]